MKQSLAIRYSFAIVAACLTASAATALAQPRPGGKHGPGPGGCPFAERGHGEHGCPHRAMGGGPGSPGGPEEHRIRKEMMKHLYRVEMVRRHSDEIGLSDKQYEKLRSLVVKVKSEVEQITWDMDREARKLVELVEKGAKTEAIHAQMDRVFEHENRIKKLHLGLLLSVREVLTVKQRKRLDAIKQQRREKIAEGTKPGGYKTSKAAGKPGKKR